MMLKQPASKEVWSGKKIASGVLTGRDDVGIISKRYKQWLRMDAATKQDKFRI